jgi:hypothetical protein
VAFVEAARHPLQPRRVALAERVRHPVQVALLALAVVFFPPLLSHRKNPRAQPILGRRRLQCADQFAPRGADALEERRHRLGVPVLPVRQQRLAVGRREAGRVFGHDALDAPRVHRFVEAGDQGERFLDGTVLAGRRLRQQLLGHAPDDAFEHVDLAHQVAQLVEQAGAELLSFFCGFSHAAGVAACRAARTMSQRRRAM